MFPDADSNAQEELASGRLGLYSLARCTALLGTCREHLRFVAGHAGSYYRPFEKYKKRRPFQKKVDPLRKKPRVIDNPGHELKSLQTRINDRLLKPLAFPHYLCGGVSGKAVLDNVLLHLGAPVLVTVDIKSFFRSITNQQVYRVWREILDCSPRIAALLTRLTTFERHLPQGAPTSSLLANLVLFSVDRSIREECARRGVTYSTWVDDLAFSGEGAREVIATVVAALRRAGFSLSHKKLKVMGRGTRKVLNGVLANQFPNVLPDRIARLRSGIHKLETGQVAAHEAGRYVRQLRGGIAYVASIAPRKAARLTKELAIATAANITGRA
jgi:retron-type reverse transcriptase